MIVILNNKDFEIYELDDRDNVLNRIAFEYNTLPKYLYFEIPFEIKEGYKTKVIDYLEVIQKYKEMDFNKLHTIVKDKLPFLKTQEDILYPWICYSEYINKIMKDVTTRRLILYSIDEEINTLFNIKPELSIEKVKLDDCKEYMSILNKDKKELEKKLVNRMKIINFYNKITNGIKYGEFTIEKSEINYTIDSQYTSLMELFNTIRISKNIPCVSFNNFFKISKEYPQLIEWNKSLNNIIIMRILEKEYPRQVKIENYSVTYIGLANDYPVIKMISNPSYLNIKQDIYKTFIFKSLNEPKILKVEEELIKGIYNIPNQSFDKYVFSDMVLNNPIFSSILNINEKDVASKSKSELYIYLNHPIYGIITGNIIENNDTVTSEYYIRMHITKAKNSLAVNAFQETLSKLFVLYNQEYNNIVREYKKYIPNFGEKDKIIKEEHKKTLRLGDVNPDIIHIPKGDNLKVTYTRMCDHIPRVVSEEEAKDIGKYMQYPKENIYDGQHYYVCDEYTDYKHPGLINNKFQSKDKVIGLPCCYKEDQTKKDSLYNKYYNNIEQKKQGKKIISQKMIVSNKFIGVTSTGILPKNISSFFESIDPLNEYRRTGMSRGPNSFIECILEAMSIGIFTNIITNEEERIKFVENERKTLLSKLSYTGICRQEMYTYSTEDINKYVKSNEYMSPKNFISLLEEAYKCNIYIFTRDNDDNGELTLPNFSQYYLKYTNENPSIFIYENPGNVADVAEFPQCELIIKFTEGKSNYSFDYNEIVSVQVKKMYDNLAISYNYNKKINDIIIPTQKIMKNIIKQLIDVNGKCRILYIKCGSYANNKILTLITDPIPPLAIPEMTNLNNKIVLQKITYDESLNFIKEYKIALTKQVIKNGIVKQLIGIFGNINVTIPIEDITEIRGIEITNDMTFIENTESVMDKYNKNKKYAKYITEYAFWLLSKYINVNDISNITNNEILNFLKDNVKIISNFKYEKVDKLFNLDSGVLYKKKLIVLNKQTYDKLYYVLILAIIRNKNKILNYHKYTTMDSYFDDITDLDHYPNQVILYGSYSLEKWINEKRIEYKIYNSIQLNNTHIPYFFKNENISENIFLAQNTDSIKKSIDISKIWMKNKYNIGNNIGNNASEDSELYKLTLYAYESENKIKIYTVDGIQNVYDIKILGYKILLNDTLSTKFTVLLPL